MDKIDYLILSELLKDGGLSFLTISKKVGTSPDTVRRRYDKMKKEGIIRSCVISIDLSKLGYQGKVFLWITISPNSNRSETISHLAKVRNIIVVTELIGPFEILAIAPVKDLRSIETVVKEARKAPNVQRIEISCVDDSQFPVNPNFGAVLSKKSQSLANK